MKLKVKILKLMAGRPVAILHKKTADKISVNIDDRITLNKDSKKIISIVDIATGLLKKDEIAVSNEIVKALKLREDELIDINIAPHPESINLIYKKLKCHPLNEKELKKIISDIVKNALTEPEIAYFVSAMYKCGMSIEEVKYLIKATIDTGKKLKLRGKIADKHGIGGIAGNRTTPIIVAICASAGLTIPKTSSRAITSAAGTADVIEAVAKVEFSIPQLYKIIKKTKACIVWGGSLGLAPADDKIIQIERLLNLDPEPQLLASILSKKLSVGSEYVLIDIPYGKSAKVLKNKALHLKKRFEKLARYFNLNIKCVLTDGSQPIGNGIGPVLEIRDLLAILRQEPNRPLDLEKKSLMLAALLLEMTGKAKKRKSKEMAKKILQSGKAFKKFQEIIKAQGGSLSNGKLKLGSFSKEIKASRTGRIMEIDNKKINFLARLLGCPADKRAGIYLYKHKNSKVKKGTTLMTFYAESEEKLKEALVFHKKIKPIKIK
jgi:AMP phosphorylase